MTMITAPVSQSDYVSLYGRIYRNRYPMDDLRELCPTPGLIIDCGAGEGFFAEECWRTFGDNIEVISFEPVGTLQKVIEQKTASNTRWRSYKCALGSKKCVSTINLTRHPKSNSFLAFLPNGPLADILDVVGTEEVNIYPLDELPSVACANNISILKLDVQGYELEVFKGCTKLLESGPIIFCEIALKQQYRDQPLVEDVDAYLATFGYHRKYTYVSACPDIWSDAIYVKETEDAINSAVRLNIGAGSTVIDGWIPIDRKLGIEAYPLQYQDNSVDEIRASHILEHFSFADALTALRDWTRALKPGCRIRISVPDMDKISQMKSTERRFFLMGGQTDQNDFHRSAYDEPHLSALMRSCGLANIKKWTSENTDSASHPCSLNLEGTKAISSVDKDIKITAIMSIPRIGWNDSWGSVLEALSPFRIPVRRFTGVYWGQCMQRLFNECIQDEIDWILTIDYDSMFTAKHLDKLIGRFGEHQEIDALAALQCRRSDDFPLMTCKGETEVETNGEAIKATTAHFGLTLIRADALKDVPKPWFKGDPDKDGEWGTDRLDDDIWFWHQWRQAGKTIYVDPEVRIGHLEVVVSDFDQNLQARRMHVDEWRKENGIKSDKC